MTDTTNAPGLPTVAQVTDHEQHGGLWRINYDGVTPDYIRLRVADEGVEWRDGGKPWRLLSGPGWAGLTWTPCDQQGNPLGLVDALEAAEACAEDDECANAEAQAETERWRARAEQSEQANEKHTERIRAMEVRLGGLESDLAAARAALPNLYSYRVKSIADGIRELIRVRDSHFDGRMEASSDRAAGKAAHSEAHGRSELECPCCGDVAAEGDMHDGDPLRCGCAGIVSLDRETPPYVVLSDFPCPPSARCQRDARPAKVETCGECRKYVEERSAPFVGFVPGCGPSPLLQVHKDNAPPDDCPGAEPRE